jgi:hypothetical protein
MQTRKECGIVGGEKGAIRIGTNGRGEVQVDIRWRGNAWTGPDLTVEEVRDLIGKLTGAAIAAAIEIERETVREGMARHLGVRPDEIVISEPARPPTGTPCPLNRCDHHGPGGCFDPGCRAAEGRVHP